MLREQHLRAPAAAHRHLASRVHRAVEDRLGDQLGVVDRRRHLRLAAWPVVLGMLADRRVDARRFHQRDRDRHAVRRQLHAQCLDIGLHRVLGRRIDAHRRRRHIRRQRSQRDQRPARLQVRHRRDAAVHHAEIVGPEQPFLLVDGRVEHLAEDRRARVVHPGVDPPEHLHRIVRRLHAAQVADVGRLRLDAAAVRLHLRDQPAQHVLRPGDHQHARAALRRHARGDQADPGTRPRDDDHLLVQRLQCDRHGLGSGQAFAPNPAGEAGVPGA